VNTVAGERAAFSKRWGRKHIRSECLRKKNRLDLVLDGERCGIEGDMDELTQKALPKLSDPDRPWGGWMCRGESPPDHILSGLKGGGGGLPSGGRESERGLRKKKGFRASIE